MQVYCCSELLVRMFSRWARSLSTSPQANLNKLLPDRTEREISTNRSHVVLNQRLLHEGPDTLEELLGRRLVKTEKSLDEEEDAILNQRRLTSTGREALHLYRDILRATRFFLEARFASSVVERCLEGECQEGV